MSSPNLNYFLLTGAALVFIFTVTLGIDAKVVDEQKIQAACKVHAWLMVMGFTLIFGTLFAKTWRVYSIFTTRHPTKGIMSDRKLICIVLVLLALDASVLLLWELFDERTSTRQSQVNQVAQNDELIITTTNTVKCTPAFSWIAGIAIFKGLFLIFGAFLAYQTRHVSVPGLDNSKYIGMSIYNVVVFSIIVLPLAIILPDNNDTNFIITSSIILFCLATTLGLLFIPKIIALYTEVGKDGTGTSLTVQFRFNGNSTKVSPSQSVAIEDTLTNH